MIFSMLLNTVSCITTQMTIQCLLQTVFYQNLLKTFVEDSLLLIKWFADNHMKANPDRFQATAVGKCTKDENITSIWTKISLNVRNM